MANVTLEPTFVGGGELPVQNLQLQGTSPGVNSGTALAQVTEDFSGGARPSGSAYDMGAFEFGAQPADGAEPGAAGGSRASAAAGGADPGSGARDADPGGDAPDDSGGCGCRQPPRHHGESPAPHCIALALTLLCIRRRAGLPLKPWSVKQ